MSIYLIEFKLLMLIAGIILSVITLLRMRSGQITLSRWAKLLLTVGMLALLVILLLSMLPPVAQEVSDSFITKETFLITPDSQ